MILYDFILFRYSKKQKQSCPAKQNAESKEMNHFLQNMHRQFPLLVINVFALIFLILRVWICRHLNPSKSPKLLVEMVHDKKKKERKKSDTRADIDQSCQVSVTATWISFPEQVSVDTPPDNQLQNKYCCTRRRNYKRASFNISLHFIGNFKRASSN